MKGSSRSNRAGSTKQSPQSLEADIRKYDRKFVLALMPLGGNTIVTGMIAVVKDPRTPIYFRLKALTILMLGDVALKGSSAAEVASSIARRSAWSIAAMETLEICCKLYRDPRGRVEIDHIKGILIREEKELNKEIARDKETAHDLEPDTD